MEDINRIIAEYISEDTWEYMCKDADNKMFVNEHMPLNMCIIIACYTDMLDCVNQSIEAKVDHIDSMGWQHLCYAGCRYVSDLWFQYLVKSNVNKLDAECWSIIWSGARYNYWARSLVIANVHMFDSSCFHKLCRDSCQYNASDWLISFVESIADKLDGECWEILLA